MGLTQRELNFEQRVDDRIERLLARVEGIRRGTDISRPHVFNAEGEAHAQWIAQRDKENTRG